MQRWGQVGKVFLVFLIFLILLLLFLSLTVVRVWVNYSRQGRNDKLALGFSAWYGLINYNFELPKVEVEKRKWRTVINIKTKFEKKNVVFFYLLKKVRLRRLTWHTEIGTGDPSQTGLLTGVVWGLKGLILTAFNRLLAPGSAGPVVEIWPSFDKACFNTALDCAFDVRLYHLFITGLKYLIIKRK